MKQWNEWKEHTAIQNNAQTWYGVLHEIQLMSLHLEREMCIAFNFHKHLDIDLVMFHSLFCSLSLANTYIRFGYLLCWAININKISLLLWVRCLVRLLHTKFGIQRKLSKFKRASAHTKRMYFDYRELTICHYKLHAQNVLNEWTRHLCDHVMDAGTHVIHTTNSPMAWLFSLLVKLYSQ